MTMETIRMNKIVCTTYPETVLGPFNNYLCEFVYKNIHKCQHTYMTIHALTPHTRVGV